MRLIDLDRLIAKEHTLDVDGIQLHTEWYSIYELEAEPIVEIDEKYKEFTLWVANYIFDHDDRDCCYSEFAEFICRKLYK